MNKALKDELLKKYNILNWFLGNVFVSLGVAFATKADLGLSMIATVFNAKLIKTWGLLIDKLEK